MNHNIDISSDSAHFMYLRYGSLNGSYFIHLLMKMEPIRSSETSATKNQTPENHPKKNSLQFV